MRLLSNPLPDNHHHEAAGEGRGGGLQRLRSLHYLLVFLCPELLSSYSSSSSSFSPFPTSLQHLTLDGMGYMETRALSNLTSLTELSLNELGDSRGEGLWPLLTHGRLTFLGLKSFAGSHPSQLHDKEESPRSSKLLYLRTRSNTGFLAAPICSLLSSTLARLDLSFGYDVERLTKGQEEALQLLTSLQELRLARGPKLQRLPAGLHELISLKELTIGSCDAIQSLPSLPSSLQELVIDGCGAIKSLPNSLPGSLERLEISSCKAIKSLPNSLPSSLERLEISNCEAIKSLPKDGFPSSMRLLDVCHEDNSEELKRACRKLIGTIPIIKA